MMDDIEDSPLWKQMFGERELGPLELSNLLSAPRSADQPLNETMRRFIETKAGTVH